MVSKLDLLQEIKKVRNIIFDMDGTLINTAQIAVQACQEAALEFDLPIPHAEKITGLIGWANCDFFPKLYPEAEEDLLEKYAQLVCEKEHIIMEKLKEKLLFPGVMEMLSVLKLKGYNLFIASTGSTQHVNFALRNSNIYSFFDNIKCNQPEKIKMVEEIIKGGPKGGFIIMGDKCKDYEAGDANNIITVGAAYGFGSKEEIEKFDLTLSQPLDLLRHLE
ncbi:HAD family hydrolase [Candidatus Clostridium radicumherbarum]|uniref:HAD family hydrolase n=1 Tax=Candidatus Clostridium radicumherbarum TaxID=3381662 RepID=A0ABW8TT31_9CLOT